MKGSPNPDQKTRPCGKWKKKKKFKNNIMDFVVQVDHSVKIKDIERIDRYLGFSWEVNKRWKSGDVYISCI